MSALDRYPTMIPSAEAKIVLDFVRGAGGDKKTVGEAGWWISGWALDNIPNFIPSPTQITFGANERDDASLQAECESALESLSQGVQTQTMAAGGTILVTLATYLIPLLFKLLQK